MPCSGWEGEGRGDGLLAAQAARGRRGLKFVARVALSRLQGGTPVRLEYPPFHVLVALVDGVAHAIEDACNHAGASLSEGDVAGGCVSCPMHGYVFDLATGHLVEPRGLCGDQRVFVTRLDGRDVEVWDPGASIAILDARATGRDQK